MAAKTDRILGYLPGTYAASAAQSALGAVVGAVGDELQRAENALAALMQAHWVAHADRGADRLDDLVRIAALYGLAPRPDEDVEAFRAHLLRFVQLFLAGTATVPGILRVTAETLGLAIEDVPDRLDAWWDRPDGDLVTPEPRGEDAASLLLGRAAGGAVGSTEQAASVTGGVDLSTGVDLRSGSLLRLSVDGASAVAIDLTAGADPEAVDLGRIVSAVNAALPGTAAAAAGRLVLTSPTTGPGSRLIVADGPDDAAGAVLGLAPRTRTGSPAAAARIVGDVDLSGGADLSVERYLRIAVDARVAEVECAGSDSSHTSLDTICAAVNTALGLGEVATPAGGRLRLVSPTAGPAGRLEIQSAAAQDASRRLLGSAPRLVLGDAEGPARMTGPPLPTGGLDLRGRSLLDVVVDEAPPVRVDCAGADPANTRPMEVVDAVNAAAGPGVARFDGRSLVLTSRNTGPAARIALGSPPADASGLLFGVGPRTFEGRAASPARLAGVIELAGGTDLRARHVLRIALDGRPAVDADLLPHLDHPSAASPADLARAVNDALAATVATAENDHLVLTSPTTGDTSALAVEPLQRHRRRAFVSRVAVAAEAARTVLGTVSAVATGTASTRAILTGTTDLSRAVDLSTVPWLRIAVDGAAPVEVNCAGARPRATTLDEIVAAISAALPGIGSHDGTHLVLASATEGPASSVEVTLAHGADATRELLGVPAAAAHGEPVGGVTLLGTVDLAGGVDLSAADRIVVTVDDAPAREIACAGANPARTTLDELVRAINREVGTVLARPDGGRLRLTSPTVGAGSRLRVADPVGGGATAVLLGVPPPREYRGHDPAPAQLTGRTDLSTPQDLRVRRWLRITVDDDPPKEVDCAANAGSVAAVTLGEIVAALTAALGDGVASQAGHRLVLRSRRTGPAGRLDAAPATAGDASAVLIGRPPSRAHGRAPASASLAGTTGLLAPVDLSDRRWLRLAVDDAYPLDIDIAGAAPEATHLDEIVAAVNRALPGTATTTDDDRLSLRSPTTGTHSRIAVLPLRFIEVVEYSAGADALRVGVLRHGDGWTVDNTGAADAAVTVELRAPLGLAGIALINETTGGQARLLATVRSGETVWLGVDPGGVPAAAVRAVGGDLRPVPADQLVTGPLGGLVAVPFAGRWPLVRDPAGGVAAHLAAPLAPRVVTLRGQRRGERSGTIGVIAVEHDLSAGQPPVVPAPGGVASLDGRLRGDAGGDYLVDAAGQRLAALVRGAGAPDARAYLDRVVRVTGRLLPDRSPTLLVTQVARLYDVTVATSASTERYPAATVGTGTPRPDDLVTRINTGAARSRLVVAEELPAGTAFALPRGRTRWRYLEGDAARFGWARFDCARFAGGTFREVGVLDVSRFNLGAPDPVIPVFGPSPATADSAPVASMAWETRRTGTCVVNLPADLPERFGGRFGEARFGTAAEPELFPGTVLEPPGDPDWLVTLVTDGRPPIRPSALVTAEHVTLVPLGFTPVTLPLRTARRLVLGGPDQAAQLYLAERGATGFVRLSARTNGAWGNAITVTARPVGPARFDVAIAYEAGRFESARATVYGPPLSASSAQLLQPSALGLQQAKAAGVAISVTRDPSAVRH